MLPAPQANAPTGRRSGRMVCAAAWVVCMLACILMTHITRYHVHDPDSRLYAAMAQDLAQRPFRVWCAPEWNGHWQRHGLFYEHPAGLLWAGAALVRAGCNPEQALYVCNFLALFASLALLYALARTLQRPSLGAKAECHTGLVAVALWMATPAFLQYLVRGNQEHPLGVAVLLGLYALVGPPKPWQAGLLWAAALTLGIAVKGIAAAALLPVAAMVLWRHDRTSARLGAVVSGCVVAAAAAWGYDAWAQHVTGASFWEHYLAGQVQHSVGVGSLARKIDNAMYYAARPLWFGLPAVALLLAQASHWSRRAHADKGLNDCPNRSSVATELGLGVALVFVMGFSLANRKADRYIFPIYPGLALAAADFAMRQPHWRARVGRWKHAMPYAFMLFLLMAVGLKIYIGTHYYHSIRWWPGA